MIKFNETFGDGEYHRRGFEIATATRRVRVGWILGYMPTVFFFGQPSSVRNQTQLRIWRLGISITSK